MCFFIFQSINTKATLTATFQIDCIQYITQIIINKIELNMRLKDVSVSIQLTLRGTHKKLIQLNFHCKINCICQYILNYFISDIRKVKPDFTTGNDTIDLPLNIPSIGIIFMFQISIASILYFLFSGRFRTTDECCSPLS